MFWVCSRDGSLRSFGLRFFWVSWCLQIFCLYGWVGLGLVWFFPCQCLRFMVGVTRVESYVGLILSAEFSVFRSSR